MEFVLNLRPIGRAVRGRLDPLARSWSWLRQCRERRRQRRALAQLDERLLRDIGLSRMQAAAERAKPFWKE